MITIKLTNKVAYTLIAILALLITSLIVYAVNPTTKPNPGHASNEVMVNINGTDKTLQAAIDDGDFGGINNSSVELGDSTYYDCAGTTRQNIPGMWHICYFSGIYHGDVGSDSDFRKEVSHGSPDAQGKMAWKVMIKCENDRQGSVVTCFNII